MRTVIRPAGSFGREIARGARHVAAMRPRTARCAEHILCVERTSDGLARFRKVSSRPEGVVGVQNGRSWLMEAQSQCARGAATVPRMFTMY